MSLPLNKLTQKDSLQNIFYPLTKLPVDSQKKQPSGHSNCLISIISECLITRTGQYNMLEISEVQPMSGSSFLFSGFPSPVLYCPVCLSPSRSPSVCITFCLVSESHAQRQAASQSLVACRRPIDDISHS